MNHKHTVLLLNTPAQRCKWHELRSPNSRTNYLWTAPWLSITLNGEVLIQKWKTLSFHHSKTTKPRSYKNVYNLHFQFSRLNNAQNNPLWLNALLLLRRSARNGVFVYIRSVSNHKDF